MIAGFQEAKSLIDKLPEGFENAKGIRREDTVSARMRRRRKVEVGVLAYGAGEKEYK